ncbi:cytochrome P450 87A3-like [Phalaenopsis equestris]|uniref:cytochrome P450 87A3-like n=1 Tax=Phalaenopsis equestris TaxID=78828 RepID=UPI0009E55A1F|nr:cytochrome P450 87A3-like [Phalaenopsis equestris]
MTFLGGIGNFSRSIFRFITVIIFHNTTDDLKKNFLAFSAGLLAFPFNIPGTTYHKCLKGRKNVMKLLRKLSAERKNSPQKTCTDYLDFVIEELRNDNSMLTESVALNLMFALLYASSETPAPALCLAVKTLADHPKILEELTEEHDAIIRSRKDPNSGITWEEYKSMKFTYHVINETLRLANIAPVIFRKALKDIHINGYTIPAGWGIMICLLAVHLNPDLYEDPLTFNPWRWKDTPEKSVGTRNFMPFGLGMRLCVGAQFTKLEMAIFLHYLVTKYRWNSIKGGNTTRSPGLRFPDGYHIQVFSKE